MGRAERRRQERAARIQSNKEKCVRLTPSEYSQIKATATREAVECNAEVNFVLFALCMHDQLGTSGEDMARVFTELDDLIGQLQNGAAAFDDMRRRLKEEADFEVVMRD